MKSCIVSATLIFAGVTNAFFAPSAFTGQRLSVSIPPQVASGVNMKLFDWKRRENPEGIVLEEVRVDTLKTSPGSRKRHKRKGRGIAAGQGASCGFGMRGQKSRSGPSVRAGFEGGQTPLYRRLPKRVGSPMGPGHTKKQFNLIKLEALNSVEAGSTVNFESLFAAGIVTKTKYRWHKVVGGDELMATDLTVQAHGFTKSAVQAIEGKGGKCQLLSPTTNKVLIMENYEEDEDEGDTAEIDTDADTAESTDKSE